MQLEYGQVRDGDWHLLEYDPVTKRSVWWTLDDEGNDVLRYDMPVDPIVDVNAEICHSLSGARWGEGRRIASVPLPLYYDALDEAFQQEDQTYIKKWLNDGDNRAWRTFEGRV